MHKSACPLPSQQTVLVQLEFLVRDVNFEVVVSLSLFSNSEYRARGTPEALTPLSAA